MNLKNNYYPITLLVIIGIAFYFLAGDPFKKPSVDMGQYKTLCEQYQTAAPGKVSREAMQSLVFKINYLLPSPAAEITDPVAKAVKTCGDALNARLAKNEKK